MERLSDMKPCNTCTVDRQVGNPYIWQCECERCLRPSQWKDKCVNKLWQYERLQEQGRLLKLPCAVGDVVYIIDRVSKEKIIPITVSNFKIFAGGLKMECVDKWYGGYMFWEADLRKTVFFTREEAEAAIKEMEVGT